MASGGSLRLSQKIEKQLRSKIDRWQKAIKANPIKFWATALLVLGLVGALLNPVLPVENLRTLLSVLIGAQASVLAIVISVTLISTQLVATRYAPRMATLPFRTNLFKSAFVLFAISIFLDVVLLLGTTSTTNSTYTGGVFIAVGLFFVVLGFLYSFIRGMVAQSSPENLVTLFTETISPEEYLYRSQALADSPEKNAHPLQPLYRFIMSALSKGEFGTANAALDQYEQYSSEMMEELDDRGVIESSAVDCKDELFGPVLKEHLHSITTHAAERDEYPILSAAIEAQVNLGKQAMGASGHNRFPNQALQGLRATITQIPVNEEEHMTFNRVWPAVAELMLEETKYNKHRVLLSGSNIISGWLATSLRRSNNPQWHNDSLRQLFDKICESHTNSLKKVGEERDFSEVEFDEHPSENDIESSEFLNQVHHTKEALIAATSTFLQFRINEGYHPAIEGSFRRNWRDLCVSVEEMGAEDHAVWLCEVVIEMAFVENLHTPYNHSPSGPPEVGKVPDDFFYWGRELAEISEDTSHSVVEQAFDNILQYEHQSEPDPILMTGLSEEARNVYYNTNLNVQGHSYLNTENLYPDLLTELRKRYLKE